MPTKSDFKAAEEIKAILNDRDKAEQERIMRWVSESIGIVLVPGTAGGNVAQQITPSSNLQAGPATAAGRRRDIKTFVSEKSPKNDVQFAAVAAYFYRFEASDAERKEVIVPKDLQNAGRQARGYGFTNPLTTLNNAVTLGYFDRAKRGEFRLNAVGENLVAMTLPSGSASGSKPSRGKKKKKRSKIRKKASSRNIF